MSAKTIVYAAMVATASAQIPNMNMGEICGPLMKMSSCVQPLIDLVKDEKCSVLSAYTEGLGDMNPAEMMGPICSNTASGRRLLSADVEDAKRAVSTVHEHSRRLAEGMAAMGANPDFDADTLAALCADDSNCLQGLFRGMKNMMPCLTDALTDFEAVFAKMGIDMKTMGFSFKDMLPMMGPILDQAEATFKQICTVNAKGDYCITKYSDFSFDGSSLETTCDQALDMGCCLGTAPRIMKASGMASLAESSTSAVLSLCGWKALPQACVASGETVTVAKLNFVLNVGKSKVDQLDGPALVALKAAIMRDVAKKLGVPVTALDLGQLLGDDSKLELTIEATPTTGMVAAEIAAAFKGDVDLPETQKLLEANAIVDAGTTVTSSNMTAAQEVQNSPINLETSGAAQASPSLFLAAVAAALLIAH